MKMFTFFAEYIFYTFSNGYYTIQVVVVGTAASSNLQIYKKMYDIFSNIK